MVIRKTKKKMGGRGTQGGRVIENIAYRTFASKGSNGEEEHIIIVRGSANVACSLSIQAGTDDAYAPVKMTSVRDEHGKAMKISDEKITDLVFDQNGLIQLRVTFDSQERYSLNVTAYEI